MAQTTGAKAFVIAKVEYNTTGTTWTAFRDFMSAVAVSGGERNYGEAYTSDGDTPIVRAGKRTPVEVVVRYVYTEGTSDPFDIFRAQYETAAGGQANIRWSPGGTTGDFLFTSDTGSDQTILTGFGYPQGEVEPGDPIMCEVTFVTADVTKGTIS